MVAKDRTYLAVDYGSRRLGLAKSDPTGVIASPLKTVEVRSRREAVEKLRQVIEEHAPTGIVVGYPWFPSGAKSEQCREVDRFVEKLKTVYAGPIHLEDEQYTSAEATAVVHAHGKQAGRDKKRIDRIAAVIILQRFLDGLPAE